MSYRNMRAYIRTVMKSRTKSVATAAAVTVVAVGCMWKLEVPQSFFERRVNAGLAEFNLRIAPRKKRLFAGMEELKIEKMKKLHAVSGPDNGVKLTVLDIGCGAGPNLGYYPAGTEVICVEPNAHYERDVREACEKTAGVEVAAFHARGVEQLSKLVEPGTVDAVVATEVLCQMKDIDGCLHEIIRVLRPGGKLFFMQHVLSSDEHSSVRRIQLAMNRIAVLVIGRTFAPSPQDSIRRAGFSRVDLDEFEAHELTDADKWIQPVILVRSHISGTATK